MSLVWIYICNVLLIYLVTVPSMSDTTILAVLLSRKMLASLVTTLPELVSTLYSRLFIPGLRMDRFKLGS